MPRVDCLWPEANKTTHVKDLRTIVGVKNALCPCITVIHSRYLWLNLLQHISLKSSFGFNHKNHFASESLTIPRVGNSQNLELTLFIYAI
jgi:hypothetical protein